MVKIRHLKPKYKSSPNGIECSKCGELKASVNEDGVCYDCWLEEKYNKENPMREFLSAQLPNMQPNTDAITKTLVVKNRRQQNIEDSKILFSDLVHPNTGELFNNSYIEQAKRIGLDPVDIARRKKLIELRNEYVGPKDVKTIGNRIKTNDVRNTVILKDDPIVESIFRNEKNFKYEEMLNPFTYKTPSRMPRRKQLKDFKTYEEYEQYTEDKEAGIQ